MSQSGAEKEMYYASQSLRREMKARDRSGTWDQPDFNGLPLGRREIIRQARKAEILDASAALAEQASAKIPLVPGRRADAPQPKALTPPSDRYVSSPVHRSRTELLRDRQLRRLSEAHRTRLAVDDKVEAALPPRTVSHSSIPTIHRPLSPSLYNRVPSEPLPMSRRGLREDASLSYEAEEVPFYKLEGTHQGLGERGDAWRLPRAGILDKDAGPMSGIAPLRVPGTSASGNAVRARHRGLNQSVSVPDRLGAHAYASQVLVDRQKRHRLVEDLSLARKKPPVLQRSATTQPRRQRVKRFTQVWAWI
ncbi:hypothetical protein KIPB_009460 [Kipferlia bialata]|uniref:Uncharacterized protein n=1 Tax=Kipferlia bialata TaxID=797122 RepID=A0A9K3D1P7_9EUKA|nr:hypothetical protein KIPB_009460 [Kipferlia bialata]|eukprot:g9460.t1